MSRLIAVADIGGTNARFALARLDGQKVVSVGVPNTLQASHGSSSFGAAWKQFVGKLDGPAPDALGLAVAGPVEGDSVKLTNSDWTIDREGLRSLGIKEFRIINDFGAVAHAVTALGDEHFLHLCGPAGRLPREGVTTLLGPGTGLGVAMIVGPEGDRRIVETEGGHIAFAPGDEAEEDMLRRLRPRLGRVEAENVASGPGLRNLQLGLTGAEPEGDDKALWQNTDAVTLDRWCAILGGIGGDLALAHGADSVVVAGGLGYRLRDVLPDSGFAARFVAKGRFEERMRALPVRILDHPQPGLLGAAIAFARG